MRLQRDEDLRRRHESEEQKKAYDQRKKLEDKKMEETLENYRLASELRFKSEQRQAMLEQEKRF